MACVTAACATAGRPALLLAAWGFSGAALNPFLPLCFSTAAEISFPVSADLSTGVLMVGGNLAGALLVVLLPLLAQPACGDVWSSTVALVLVATIACSLGASLFLRPDYRREAEEKADGVCEPLLSE